MPMSKLPKFRVAGLGLAVVLAGCSSSATPNGSGGSSSSGGAAGSGGSGTGGVTGSGGATSSGGTTTSSGGSTSSGGAAGGAVGGSGGGAGRGGGAGHGASDGGTAGSGSGGSAGGAGSGSFVLSSPDHRDGAHFASKFTCAAMNGQFGSGVNPELDWSGAPDGTKSFAITFIDTSIGADMQKGQHWAAWDIAPTVMKLPQGTMTLTGDLMGAKQNGKFLSPCAGSPASGPNDMDVYEFTVYALATAALGPNNGASVAMALTALKGVTPLGTASLKGTAGPMGK